MSDDFSLNVELRSDKGKGASRRLRRLADKIPAILYGGEEAPLNLAIAHKDISKALENEAFYSHVLTLHIEGKQQSALLKDVQRHPAKPFIMHVDFQRVSASTKVHTKVPLHYVNEDKCVGVKAGGQISHSITEVEITCLPADLPEYIEIDMAAVDMGQTLHLSDIPVPNGVTLVQLTHGADHDLPIVNVHAVKGASSDEEAEGEGGDEA